MNQTVNKAIILAAGRGTRMGPYGADQPKGMLDVMGQPLLQHQINTLRATGIDEIIIVTGYRQEAIQFDGVRTYHNPLYAETNMVESLMCARSECNGDLLISYADILYSAACVQQLCHDASGDVVVAVDSNWRPYWQDRLGTTETDLESLTVEDGRITELGRPLTDSAGLDYRYIGLLKFTAAAWPRVFEVYDRQQAAQSVWPSSGKPFPQGYMTDLLNELIRAGVPVGISSTDRQWIELDTAEDYEWLLRRGLPFPV